MITNVVRPEYDHYIGLPLEESLFNPLTDISAGLKEKDELMEFYKLCNEYYSPELGIKYLLGVNLYPFQMSAVRAVLGHKFPLLLFTRGGGKTFLLAVYAVYHAIMFPNSRIVLVSASFRQSKLIFNEIQRIYKNAPLLRFISEDQPRIGTDTCHYKLCGSIIKALPLGTGDKIRGERGHVILADEFNSIPIEVFDVVVRGFGATEADPWRKTRDAIIRSREDKKEDDVKDKALADLMVSEGNKIILSGTAGFKGGTFYRLFSQYSKIISNGIRGRAGQYEDIFEDGELADDVHIDCSDYCVCRYTYEQLPFKMQDVKLIQNAQTTMPRPLFRMEYFAEFADDTLGFFKARDIEKATSRPPGGFFVKIRGEKNRNYVIGVDPAKTHDRFAIVVIELGTPNKVVYCWTMEEGEQSYTTATKHLRELMRRFNTIAIAMDEGGGGLAVEELLNNGDIMQDGDTKVYRFDDETMEAKEGLRLLYMFAFNPNWLDDANSLLQKNIEDKVIMFPAAQTDKGLGDGNFEQYDDVAYEVLEMKKELVSIEVTYTRTGKKQFNLAPPDPKKDIDTVVRHKDRYSALLLCNYVASRMSALNYDEVEFARAKYYDSLNYCGWAEDVAQNLK